MGKKAIAAAALLGLALRAAVLAGAGEEMERFVRSHWGDGKLVRATLDIELGAHGGAAGSPGWSRLRRKRRRAFRTRRRRTAWWR